MIQVNFVKLRPSAHVPVYATPGSAAADLFACLDDITEIGDLTVEDGSVIIPAGGRAAIPTGLAIEPIINHPHSPTLGEKGDPPLRLHGEGAHSGENCEKHHHGHKPHHAPFAFAHADNFVALIFGRSGNGAKFGVTLANSVGVVDSDYRGEIKVVLINHGSQPFKVSHGDRIAQIAFMPVATAKFVEAASLGDTERGTGGFGSTGR